MTMTTADLGVATAVADTHDTDAKQVSKASMYLLALVIIGAAAALVATFGFGGIILWGVGMTWIILTFLVIMTAGG